MSRRRTPCFLVFSLIALIPFALASAKDKSPLPLTYTYTILDIPAPAITPPRFLGLNALANNGTLAGFFSMDQGYGARVGTDKTLHPVMCPAEVFQRYPFAANSGPQVVGMNNDAVVVGNDEGLTAITAMTQTPDGMCAFFLVPGSVGTWATGINDLGHVVGFSWNATGNPAEPGLLRFHGFLKDAGGIVRLDGPGPHDVVFPTAINDVGQIVGYLYSDVQPDNSYVYHAFKYENGTYEIVDDPSGADIWLLGLNNVGQAVGIVGSDGVTGGQAFLLDNGTFLPLNLPTVTTVSLQPTAINDHGQLVGNYAERDTTGRLAFHQFKATPDQQNHGQTMAHVPKGITRALASIEKDARRQIQSPRFHGLLQQFSPELDVDGEVVLRNGQQILGRVHQDGKK